jgi:NAD(P)-dependent dehydrogenase (short-subunit alcohol dehydrogenase family)
MTATLITGANKGLGFETARRLIAAGHTVYVGSRDAERGHQAAEQLGARAVQLDVTNDTSVEAAVTAIEADGGLDVLVNNAGIAAEWGDTNVVIGAADVTAEVMRQTFETNVFGTVRILHAFLPLLRRSTAPVIVNVSSGLASLARVTTPGTPAYAYPGVAYPASKTAVNMITVQYAKAFPNMRINAVEPGFTKTDLNGNTGLQTVEQGAEIIVRMAQVGPDGPRGATSTPQAPFPGNPNRAPSDTPKCVWLGYAPTSHMRLPRRASR